MGVNTLDKSNLASGRPFRSSSVNQYHDALDGDIVGRESGVPVPGQSLGNPQFPWGNIYSDNLLVKGEAIDFSGLASERYRILSGETHNGIPSFLRPAGTVRSFGIHGEDVPLELLINGRNVTIDSLITVTIPEPELPTTYMTIATGVPDHQFSSFVPEDDDRLFMGEIDRLSGFPATFSPPWNSEIGEYFTLGRKYIRRNIITSADEGFLYPMLCYRTIHGLKFVQKYRYFFGSQVKGLGNESYLTIQSSDRGLWTHWVFIDADDVSNPVISSRSPIYSSVQPESTRISHNRLWFNTEKQTWNTFDASGEPLEKSLIPIGILVSDPNETRRIVSARGFWFDKKYSSNNTMTFGRTTRAIKDLQSDGPCTVSVDDKTFDYDVAVFNLDTTEKSMGVEKDSIVYLYVKDDGSFFIDATKYDFFESELGTSRNPARLDVTKELGNVNIPPVYVAKKKGYYHREHNWRCVGEAWIVEINNQLVFNLSNVYIATKYSTAEKFPYYYQTQVEIRPDDIANPLGFIRGVDGVTTVRQTTNNPAPYGFEVVLAREAIKYEDPTFFISHNIASVTKTFSAEGTIVSLDVVGEKHKVLFVTVYRSDNERLNNVIVRVGSSDTRAISFDFTGNKKRIVASNDARGAISIVFFLNGPDYFIRRLLNLLS